MSQSKDSSLPLSGQSSKANSPPLLPGSTIGILGGGQLGRMLAMEARRMGYRTHILDPGQDGPAAQVADQATSAAYDDLEALEAFAKSVDVATFEFENVSVAALETVERWTAIYPSKEVLYVCQNREREKKFLHEHQFPHVPFAIVSSASELEEAMGRIGQDGVLKTTDFGYDGKGQIRPKHGESVEEIWKRFGASRGIWERWAKFECEISVVCAREKIGRTACFVAVENIHSNHILDVTIAPARIPKHLCKEAAQIACRIADALDVVGLLAVEMFLLGNETLCVNELAPRPHNSGHFSFDTCVTSQFEQHLRAICGLPLGDPFLMRPTVMVNLLGDLWEKGEPDWSMILQEPHAKLHLYGKKEARKGRKMGHFCIIENTVDVALAKARRIRRQLG